MICEVESKSISISFLWTQISYNLHGQYVWNLIYVFSYMSCTRFYISIRVIRKVNLSLHVKLGFEPLFFVEKEG